MLSLYVSLRKSDLHTDSTTFVYLFYFIRRSELNFSKRDYLLLVLCISAFAASPTSLLGWTTTIRQWPINVNNDKIYLFGGLGRIFFSLFSSFHLSFLFVWYTPKYYSRLSYRIDRMLTIYSSKLQLGTHNFVLILELYHLFSNMLYFSLLPDSRNETYTIVNNKARRKSVGSGKTEKVGFLFYFQ